MAKPRSKPATRRARAGPPVVAPELPPDLRAALADRPTDPAARRRLAHYLERLPQSDEFLWLPPLLGSETALPISSLYIELGLCVAPEAASPRLLGRELTLAEALDLRHRQRLVRRLGLHDALAARARRRTVVLGDPGSGKTSLLKRVALDIVAGRLRPWRVPLFIPLSVYWENRRQATNADDLSLLRYVVAHMGLPNERLVGQSMQASLIPGFMRWARAEIEAMESLVVALAPHGVLFLLDGFDEISTDPEAVRELTAEITRLGRTFPWVLTSRRAGFHGGLYEDARYEVVDLDEVAAAELVRNWHAHHGELALGEALLEQVRAHPRLSTLARNPFLLTLLCLLHRAAGGRLPVHRAPIYEAVLNLAREQLGHRLGDPRVFTPTHLDHLANFCLWLQSEADGAPRHLFDERDWERHARGKTGPTLATPFLQSRLLDRWHFHGDYHLVHLTLHEYLVARALCDAPGRLACDARRLHRPGWREVWRFTAGVLWERGRRDEFAALVRTLLEPADLLGATYVEAAQLLAEAGIEDTRELLGFDLRERLWELWERDAPYLSDAAAQALALIAPQFVLTRALALLDGRFALTPAFGEPSAGVARILRGNVRQATTQPAAALALLGEVDDPRAEERLLDVFTQGDTALWIEASRALAARMSVAGRAKVLARVSEPDTARRMRRRVCELVVQAPHTDFVPWLLAGLGDLAHTATDDEGLFDALAAVAHPPAADALAAWLDAAPEATCLRAEALGALRACDASRALDWLVRAQDGAAPVHAMALRMDAAVAGLLDSAAWRALLADVRGDPERLRLLLDTLAEAAERGVEVSPEVLRELIGVLDDPHAGERAFDALTRVEVGRARRGAEPVQLELLRAALDGSDDARAAAAAYTLGVLGDLASLPLLLEYAGDERRSLSLRVNAVGALGHVGGSEPSCARVLAQIVTTLGAPSRADSRPGDETLAAAAADSLARLDLPRLIELRDLPVACDALARAAAEERLLVFPDGYVDRRGEWHTLAPPASTPPSAPPRADAGTLGGGVTVLAFSANCDAVEALALDEEIRDIQQKIDAAAVRGAFDLRPHLAVRPGDLISALSVHRPAIVHFGGHASARGIVLCGDDGRPHMVTGEALAALFATCRGYLRLVVLNACFSAVQARMIADAVGCAVGMAAQADDAAARVFAASFYQELGFGGSVQEAFDKGRAALHVFNLERDAEPRLFCREGLDPRAIQFVSR